MPTPIRVHSRRNRKASPRRDGAAPNPNPNPNAADRFAISMALGPTRSSASGFAAEQRKYDAGDVGGVGVRREKHVRRRNFLRLRGPAHRNVGPMLGNSF